MLLKMVTSSILRAHISQVRRAAGAYRFGIYHEGGAPEIAWKIHAKMAAEPTKVFIACDIKKWVRSCKTKGRNRRSQAMVPRFWAHKKCNQKRGRALRRQQTNHGQRRTPVAFALALRVALAEFDEEMRKQGVGWTTELEYWAYVDDITIATTAEFAPLVMTKLRETLERHGLELRKDKCTAYCPTPETVEDTREEMTQFLKWTLDGLTILGTASGGEYRTEITTGARKRANAG